MIFVRRVSTVIVALKSNDLFVKHAGLARDVLDGKSQFLSPLPQFRADHFLVSCLFQHSPKTRNSCICFTLSMVIIC